MTHLNVETLSTYLDRELGETKIREVEAHLDDCPQCQARLGGLRRIVDRLSAIPSTEPPTYLGPEVRRFTALQQSSPSLGSKLEHHAGRLSLQSPLIPVFAVVLALVLIIYLLASGLDRLIDTGTDIVIAPAEIAGPELRQIGSRVFEKQPDRWIEKGVGQQTPKRRVETDGPELAGWIRVEPELAELEGLGGVVWIVLGHELVEVDFSQP